MSLLAAREFAAAVHDVSGSSSRAARRVVLNADLLKAAKICAGDVVAIESVASDHKVRQMFGFLYVQLITIRHANPKPFCIHRPSQ